jgi:hypothetical protein
MRAVTMLVKIKVVWTFITFATLVRSLTSVVWRGVSILLRQVLQ